MSCIWVYLMLSYMKTQTMVWFKGWLWGHRHLFWSLLLCAWIRLLPGTQSVHFYFSGSHQTSVCRSSIRFLKFTLVLRFCNHSQHISFPQTGFVSSVWVLAPLVFKALQLYPKSKCRWEVWAIGSPTDQQNKTRNSDNQNIWGGIPRDRCTHSSIYTHGSRLFRSPIPTLMCCIRGSPDSDGLQFRHWPDPLSRSAARLLPLLQAAPSSSPTLTLSLPKMVTSSLNWSFSAY